jgi:hypothetical protein
MELEDLFTVFGKENVKVLSDDPKIEKLISESKERINIEMESYAQEHRSLQAEALNSASRAYLTQ